MGGRKHKVHLVGGWEVLLLPVSFSLVQQCVIGGIAVHVLSLRNKKKGLLPSILVLSFTNKSGDLEVSLNPWVLSASLRGKQK